MSHDRRAEFGFDPGKLLEKYCPVCGELRPVKPSATTTARGDIFAPNAKLRSARKAADSFEKPEPGFPDA